MAITKVKFMMQSGDRLEVQKLDTDGISPLPIVTAENGEITEVWTDAIPAVRIAAFVRSSYVYFVTDLATVASV